ncbi:Amidophosphoribosyltransferase [Luteimonas sp. 9C]|uniref:ComF family protein n=1 Tax=Luteimonas sp. 9C TaxID=2653148 RepID=UPI0012EF3DBD|nr:ComF family protein [Luteimonas sp. 9C]VXB14305.1 Amidophosphoribosyltransferase [Luteimonas sp. 9C]
MPDAVNQIPAPAVDGTWRRWLQTLLRGALPGRCLVCREPGAGGLDLCPACTAALPWMPHACRRCAQPLPTGDPVCGACLRRPPPLDTVIAAFDYGFPVDRLLPRFKFHRDLAAGALLGACLARATVAAARPVALVPVPLHLARLRARGYDQALELARLLARHHALPLRGDLLHRVRPTAPQSRLDAKARRRNVRHAFAVRCPSEVPAHVVLIDDVMTTGATLHAAAQALRRAGVGRVDAWVCARVR